MHIQFFLFLNKTFLKFKFKKSKIKIFDFKFFPIPSIIFNTSLACIPPTIFAVDPNIPSLSQFKNSSEGSV